MTDLSRAAIDISREAIEALAYRLGVIANEEVVGKPLVNVYPDARDGRAALLALRDALDAAEKERNSYERLLAEARDETKQACNEIVRLGLQEGSALSSAREENARLREALKFYADSKNWWTQNADSFGYRARAALTPRSRVMDKAEIIAALWHDLLEKDDRTSPVEYPDMALITREEFEYAILAALSSPAGASAPEPSERAREIVATIRSTFGVSYGPTKVGKLRLSDFQAAVLITDALTAARDEGRREGFAAAKSAAASVVNCWSLPTIQTPSMWLIDKAGIVADILALADQEPNDGAR